MKLLGQFIWYRLIYRDNRDSMYTYVVCFSDHKGFLRLRFSEVFDTYASLSHVVVETE